MYMYVVISAYHCALWFCIIHTANIKLPIGNIRNRNLTFYKKLYLCFI